MPRRAFRRGDNDMTTDTATMAAYDADAARYAEDWETQPAPTDLHDTVRRFFSPGPTADIGCGSGRDTAWLNAKAAAFGKIHGNIVVLQNALQVAM